MKNPKYNIRQGDSFSIYSKSKYKLKTIHNYTDLKNNEYIQRNYDILNQHLKYNQKTNINSTKPEFISNHKIRLSKSLTNLNTSTNQVPSRPNTAKSRFKDAKKEVILSEEQKLRRLDIINDLKKIDFSGKNLNDFTHLTSMDNLKIVQWVGTLRNEGEEDPQVNLKALASSNSTHDKLYQWHTARSTAMTRDPDDRPQTGINEHFEKWKLGARCPSGRTKCFPDSQVNDIAINAQKRPKTAQNLHKNRLNMESTKDLNTRNCGSINNAVQTDRPLTSCANMLNQIRNSDKQLSNYIFELNLRKN